jgi:ketosteroid isomerase-like protein
METWTEDFHDRRVDLERTIEALKDCVVAILRQRGTGKQSGVPTDLTHGCVFEFEEGRLTRVSIFATPDDALEAAGLSK